VLHDGRDVLVATSRFLRLLRDVFVGAATEAVEAAAAARLAAAAAGTSELNVTAATATEALHSSTSPSSSASQPWSSSSSSSSSSSLSSAAISVSLHQSVWRVFDRLLELRPEAFPSPDQRPSSSPTSPSSSATTPAAPNRSSGGDDGDSGGRVAVRRAMRNLVAVTVRSGLPDALLGTPEEEQRDEQQEPQESQQEKEQESRATSPSSAVKREAAKQRRGLSLPAVSRYARRAAAAGDPVWGAFLCRSPLNDDAADDDGDDGDVGHGRDNGNKEDAKEDAARALAASGSNDIRYEDADDKRALRAAPTSIFGGAHVSPALAASESYQTLSRLILRAFDPSSSSSFSSSKSPSPSRRGRGASGARRRPPPPRRRPSRTSAAAPKTADLFYGTGEGDDSNDRDSKGGGDGNNGARAGSVYGHSSTLLTLAVGYSPPPQNAHGYEGILAFTPEQVASHVTLLAHVTFCRIGTRVSNNGRQSCESGFVSVGVIMSKKCSVRGSL